MDIAFDEVNSALLGTGIGAPDLHGFLCGIYCRGVQFDTDSWQSAVSDFLPEYEHIKEYVAGVWVQISESLDSIEMKFDLFLPDENTPVTIRSTGLSDWCNGFISGYELIKPTGAEVSEEIKEVLKDFRSISRLNEHIEETEENEGDLMELEEYVRMGTILLYLESTGKGDK